MKRRVWVLFICLSILAALWPFSVEAQFTFSVTFSNLNQAIPDNQPAGLADARVIQTGLSNLFITSASVILDVGGTGARNGDLYATLTHDRGFAVLLNRVGRTAASSRGYADAGLRITLDDQAADGDVHVYRQTLFGNDTTPLGAALTGQWAPDGRNVDPATVVDVTPRNANLNSFNGLMLDGSWVLFIADLGVSGRSTLQSWGLNLVGTPDGFAPLNLGGATIRAEDQARVIGNVVQLTTGPLTVSGSQDLTLRGLISGDGGLIHSGSGVLALLGANTFSGGVQLDSGVLALGSDGALGPGPLLLRGGTVQSSGGARFIPNPMQLAGSITFGGTEPLWFAGVTTLIGTQQLTVNNVTTFAEDMGEDSPGGRLIKSGPGTLVLQSVNTFSGGLQLEAGVLAVGHDLALGSGPLQLRGGVLQSDGAHVLANPVIFDGNAAFSGDPLTLTGPCTVASSGSLTVGNEITIAGLIADGVGAQLRKSGPGTLALQGANTFSGGIVVEAGTLALDNLLGSATGTGAVIVRDLGQLAGNGACNSPVLVTAGGTASPGHSPGTLTAGPTTWNGGGRYRWEINDAAGDPGVNPGWDLIAIRGPLSITANVGDPFVIEVNSLGISNTPGPLLNFSNDQPYSWSIANATDGVSGLDVAQLEVGTTGLPSDLAGGEFRVVSAGSQVNLTFAPNRPPVATNVAFNHSGGPAFESRIADLLAHAGDPDGDAVVLHSLSLVTTNGVLLVTNGTSIFYPSPGSQPDLFTYTVRDARPYRVGDSVRTATATVTILPPATVGDRFTFYNRSAFDGNDATASVADDDAIALDKQPLRPGSVATFANYTSYSHGLNGILVDLAGRANAASLSSSDFQVRVGNNHAPATWVAGPAPASLIVRNGAGRDGADRVTLIWPDNVVQQQWLEVTVLPTARTGLAVPDVFYFGNAIGESGNSATDAKVTAIDSLGVLNHIAASANVTNHFDFNRDGKVGAADRLQVLNHVSALNPLVLLDLRDPASGGGIPAGAGAGGQAKAIPSLRLPMQVERIAANRLRLRLPIEGGAARLYEATTPGATEWAESKVLPQLDPASGLLDWIVSVDPGQPHRFFRLIPREGRQVGEQ